MAVTRVDWTDLPAEVRKIVEDLTGPVLRSQTATEGLNSAIAAVLDTPNGRFFVKGLRRDYARRWTQDMEALINPHVAHLSARMLWRVEEGDWDLLGFEHLAGTHADYRPGSSDLALVVDVMTALGEMSCPEVPVKTAAQRWSTYAKRPADREWFVGDRLLHTDYNPVNILIVGGRARLIDWAWPTKGAGWIDPACLILRLMATGHDPSEAEQVVSAAPAWKTAPAEGLMAFAEANVRLWSEVMSNDRTAWTSSMAKASEDWLTHYQATRG